MYYWVYQDSEREWRWTLYAANNKRIADSSDGYRNKQDCQDAIDRVRASAEAVVKHGPSVLAQRDTGQDRGRK
jgi:uncharacterized protein YegP (UPF0339 family)